MKQGYIPCKHILRLAMEAGIINAKAIRPSSSALPILPLCASRLRPPMDSIITLTVQLCRIKNTMN
ncbi:MAG: hypothetical protein IKH30_08590 [Clostridia bacterium]|nr:hypothetical protein [Clostridia bacterium]